MIEISLYSKHNIQEGFTFLSRKDEKLAKLIISNPNFSLSKRCTGFEEASFRDDISSTEIRLKKS